MTWQNGPALDTDSGRATAHGFTISGDDETGYRARVTLGLTEQEAAYGCQELLFSDALADLLVLAHAEKIKRSMVGQAHEAAQQP